MLKFVIFLFIFGLVVASGCISDTGGNNPDFLEKKAQEDFSVNLQSLQKNVTDGVCSISKPDGFFDIALEFLPGEINKTVNYSFFNEDSAPVEVSYSLVPVKNWKEREPVRDPDWVDVSVGPALVNIPGCRNYVSEVTVQLIQNSTRVTEKGISKELRACFLLKPSVNGTIQSEAEDWLCVERNYNNRTLLRPRMQVVMENPHLIVLPKSGNLTSIFLNTQGQSLDTIQSEILTENPMSAQVIRDGLLTISIAPSEFPVRSFRNYTLVLSANASDGLSPGMYQFRLKIQSRALTEIPFSVEIPEGSSA